MAGTINTSNYNIKKYAPNDTVSMLQTFNGNMDIIDSAIKDRENETTVNASAISKVEDGLASANDGLNSVNRTVSALQVSVTTNTRNIQSAQTELDSQDARITALEDGGSAIEKLNIYDAVAFTAKTVNVFKQGTHVFGFGAFNISSVITASNVISITSADNYPISSTLTLLKNFSLQGNIFGLNPNVGHVVGNEVSYVFTADGNYVTQCNPAFAVWDGSVTYIGVVANTGTKGMSTSLNIDTVIGY